MTKIKAASTILLARDSEDGVEVLLLKRNRALAFAAGLWVFPGGKIEDSEYAQSADELAAAKLAAVRETKEEADIEVQMDDLIFFSHWTTPKKEVRRYATYFFFANANLLTNEVKIDDSEIKDHIWVQPQTALDQLRAGQLAMLPPTIMSLQFIRKCASVSDIKVLLQKEDPIFTLPVLEAKNGQMICLYEGDAGYASANADTPGPRHRLILDMKEWDFTFEYQDCETRPVNGGMHL